MDREDSEITPVQFELLVKSYLENLDHKIVSFSIDHNLRISKIDGEYQIDVYAEFDFLGVAFKVLVECKRYKSKVKREVVQLLYDKIRATGAQKGIIFSTSGFQDGAVTFAEEHGIALITLINGIAKIRTRSMNPPEIKADYYPDIPKFVGDFRYGKMIVFLSNDNLQPLSDFLFTR